MWRYVANILRATYHHLSMGCLLTGLVVVSQWELVSTLSFLVKDLRSDFLEMLDVIAACIAHGEFQVPPEF